MNLRDSELFTQPAQVLHVVAKINRLPAGRLAAQKLAAKVMAETAVARAKGSDHRLPMRNRHGNTIEEDHRRRSLSLQLVTAAQRRSPLHAALTRYLLNT